MQYIEQYGDRIDNGGFSATCFKGHVHETRGIRPGRSQDGAIGALIIRRWHSVGLGATDSLFHYLQTDIPYIISFQKGVYQWHLGDILQRLGRSPYSYFPEDPDKVVGFSFPYDWF